MGKTKGKKLLCLLLAVLLFAAALPAGALAAEPEDGGAAVSRIGDGQGGYTLLRKSKAGLGGGEGKANVAATFAVPSGYDMGDMYSQLSKLQKDCYGALEAVTLDRVLAAAEDEEGYRWITLRIEGVNGVRLEGSIRGGEFFPSAASADLESNIQTALCLAIEAVRYDRPDIMWMDDMQYGYKVESRNGVTTIAYATVGYYLGYGDEAAQTAAMLANAQAIADKAALEPDTYGKVQAVHDLLIQGNTYGDPEEPMAHTPYSALVSEDAWEPVCDGYAKAFKMICDLLEIPCVTASSADHMWNNVKMDDGEWYNVDLTWDDDDAEEINRDYFLIGSQTVVDGTAFCQQASHTELNPFQVFWGGKIKKAVLRFPAKRETVYEYLGEDYPPLTFPDVKRNIWYYEPVEKAAGLGLFQGDTNGLFLPRKSITRAEFAQVLAKVMGADLTDPAYQVSSFSDVAAGDWYAPAVAWAKEAKMIDGYKNGTFRPGKEITRQEACKLLYGAMKSWGAAPETSGFQFPDDGQISAWAKESVYRCYAAGLIQGNANGTFSPGTNMLRSQAAVVFTNLAEIRETVPEQPAPVEPEPVQPEEPAQPEGPVEEEDQPLAG